MAGPWSPPYQPPGAPTFSGQGQNPAAIQALLNIVIALNAQTQQSTALTAAVTNVLGSKFGGGAAFASEMLSANFNSTADQPLVIATPTANWMPSAILVTNPSVSLTTAAGGIYSAAAKGGFALVAAGQSYTGLTTNAVNTAGSALLLTLNSTAFLNVTTIYLSLTTPQGAAATADVRVFIRPLY